MYKAVLEFTGDQPSWEGVLNNVENLRKSLGPSAVQIELVAHGKGLGLLKKTNSAMEARITALARDGVVFSACENTMKREGLTRQDLLPVAETVDSGVAEVVRKQGKGWSYLKVGP